MVSLMKKLICAGLLALAPLSIGNNLEAIIQPSVTSEASYSENESPKYLEDKVIVDYSGISGSERDPSELEKMRFCEQVNLAYDLLVDLTGADSPDLNEDGKLIIQFLHLDDAGGYGGNPIRLDPDDYLDFTNKDNPGHSTLHELSHDFMAYLPILYDCVAMESWAEICTSYLYDTGKFGSVGCSTFIPEWLAGGGKDSILLKSIFEIKDKYGWGFLKEFFRSYTQNNCGEEGKTITAKQRELAFHLAESVYYITNSSKDFEKAKDILTKNEFPTEFNFSYDFEKNLKSDLKSDITYLEELINDPTPNPWTEPYRLDTLWSLVIDYHLLGDRYSKEGDLIEAKICSEKVLEIRKKFDLD